MQITQTVQTCIPHAPLQVPGGLELLDWSAIMYRTLRSCVYQLRGSLRHQQIPARLHCVHVCRPVTSVLTHNTLVMPAVGPQCLALSARVTHVHCIRELSSITEDKDSQTQTGTLTHTCICICMVYL